MITSIDGRLQTKRWTAPATNISRSALMGQYEKTASEMDAPAWLVGRHTMDEITGPAPWPDAEVQTREWPRVPFLGERKGRHLAIVMDLHGRRTYASDEIDGDHATAILGYDVPDSYLSRLRACGVSYLFAASDGNGLQKAMEDLRNHFGVTSLLVEGGGITNGLFLKANLIDEISLLVYPGLDGLSGEPSIFEYPGKSGDQPAEGQILTLLSSETLPGGMLWLRYGIQHSSKTY